MENYVKLSCIIDNSMEIRRFQNEVRYRNGKISELDNTEITPEIKFLRSIKDSVIYSLNIPTKTIQVIKLSELLKVPSSQNAEKYYKSILLYNNNEPYFITNLKKAIRINKIDFDNDMNFQIYFCVDAKEDPIAKGNFMYNMLIRHRLITKPEKFNESAVTKTKTNVNTETNSKTESNIYLCKSKDKTKTSIFSDSKLADFYSEHILGKSNRGEIYQIKINSDKTMKEINYVKDLMKNKVNVYELNLNTKEAQKVNYSYLFSYPEEGIYKDKNHQYITNLKQYLKKNKNINITDIKILFLANKNEDIAIKGGNIFWILKINHFLDNIDNKIQ